MTQFTDLGLNPLLLKALTDKGYTQPTPIQAQAIPGVMSGRDLLGIAQTGTGKTAAFALPILHRLAAERKRAPRRGCRALILSPTRELASQIADQFRAYGSEFGFSVATVFGGVSFGPQARTLERGVDVLVATPGRLLDHLDQKTADLSTIEIFVLDEADQMLDMGFIVPIKQVIRRLPKVRQNLFFSATMPDDIAKLAGELLSDPLRVAVAPPATTVERINQQIVMVEAGRKRALLVELFSRPDFTRVLVFTRTKRGADRVAAMLESAGVAASAIHGNKSQNQRERALSLFKSGDVRALVATDIAARGIDISSVSHVVQFDLPEVPEQYVHRIGRTARAGADGSAVAFCAEEDRSLLRDIERTTRQKIPAVDRRGDAVLGEIAAAAPKIEAERFDDPRARQQRGRGKPGGNQPARGRRPERPAREGQRSAVDDLAIGRGDPGYSPRNQQRPAQGANGAGGQRDGQRSEGRGNGGGGAARSNGQRHAERRRNDREGDAANRDRPIEGARDTRGNAQQPKRAQGKPNGERKPDRNGPSKPHRKGPAPVAPRRDVMFSGAASSAPLMPAADLMRTLGARNPWSD